MMGRKLQKKYALTDKGLRNTRVGAAWTVVVNLLMMAGMGILYFLMQKYMHTLTGGDALPNAWLFIGLVAAFVVLSFITHDPVLSGVDGFSPADHRAVERVRTFGKAYLQALLFLEVMNWYDGIMIDRLWVGHSKFWVIPGTEGVPFVQTWKQVLKKRGILTLIWIVGAALTARIVILLF